MSSSTISNTNYLSFLDQLKKCTISHRYKSKHHYLNQFTETKPLIDVIDNGNCWIYCLLLSNNNVSLPFYQYYCCHMNNISNDDMLVNLSRISYYFWHYLVSKNISLSERTITYLYQSSYYKKTN